MEVNGQLHVSAALPQWTLWRREKFCLFSDSNPGRPVGTSVKCKWL
jgi:hypothetical protein